MMFTLGLVGGTGRMPWNATHTNPEIGLGGSQSAGGQAGFAYTGSAFGLPKTLIYAHGGVLGYGGTLLSKYFFYNPKCLTFYFSRKEMQLLD